MAAVRPNINIRGFALALALASLAAFTTSICSAADIYDAAVQHSGRTADDQKRDALDHPAQILRLAGIEPGMRVGDFMASDGYYSELLSYIVGPKGHVLLINNPSFDRWANNAWEGRIAHNRPAQRRASDYRSQPYGHRRRVSRCHAGRQGLPRPVLGRYRR